jgi:hypothetical protein
MRGLPWTARTRRLVFVVVMLLLLTFPLVSTLLTKSRIDRSGQDVVASVIHNEVDDGHYWLGYRLPADIDPDHRAWTAEVDRVTYDKASESKKLNVRVLPGRPEAHRVEGQVDSHAGLWFTVVADAIVIGVGFLWIRRGRRRPSLRMLARGDLEPAGPDDAIGIGRADGDDYEAVGTVKSTDDGEVVLDLGERDVVVALAGHGCPVEVGATARASGPLVG